MAEGVLSPAELAQLDQIEASIRDAKESMTEDEFQMLLSVIMEELGDD